MRIKFKKFRWALQELTCEGIRKMDVCFYMWVFHLFFAIKTRNSFLIIFFSFLFFVFALQLPESEHLPLGRTESFRMSTCSFLLCLAERATQQFIPDKITVYSVCRVSSSLRLQHGYIHCLQPPCVLGHVGRLDTHALLSKSVKTPGLTFICMFGFKLFFLYKKLTISS